MKEVSKRKINKISQKQNNFWKSLEKPSTSVFLPYMQAKNTARSPIIRQRAICKLLSAKITQLILVVMGQLSLNRRNQAKKYKYFLKI